MATNYPGSLDSLPRPTSTTAMNASGYEGDVVIDNLSDAIEAVQAELGTDPAGAQATVKARLEAADSGRVSNFYWPASGYISNASAANANTTNDGGVKVANVIYYSPIWIPYAGTVAEILFNITTGQPSSNAKVGLYSSSLGLPTTRLVNAGPVSTSGTGIIVVSGLSAAVAPGLHFAALLFDTAAVSLTLVHAGNRRPMATDSALDAYTTVTESMTYSTGLPATASSSPTLATTASGFLCGVRRSA